MTAVTREVEIHILIGQLYRFGAAIYRMHEFGIASHGIYGKASGIAEHIQYALAFGIMFQKRTIFALIHKETGLLTSQPVDMEFQSILNSHIVSITTQNKSVFLTEISLEWQSSFTLIINILESVAHHFCKSLSYFHSVDVHTHAMRLHHGSLSVAVDNQSRQVITLTMHQSIGIIGSIVGNTHSDTHLEGRIQTRAPELIIDGNIMERKDTNCDGTYLIMSHSNKIPGRSDDTYNLTFYDSLVHLSDSAREDPRMKTFQGLFLSPLQIYFLIHIILLSILSILYLYYTLLYMVSR